MYILCGKYKLDINTPLVMGILNLTPDSFYDGGRYDSKDSALSHADRLISEGADILDIGGESTRPGAVPVTEEEEIRRIIPVIEALSHKMAIPISVDTYKARVAQYALEAGAAIVNDISGLRFDTSMTAVIKKYNAGLVIMHTLGRPSHMQNNPVYTALIPQILTYLYEGIETAKNSGIDINSLIIDPGIGFGKSTEDNLKIIAQLSTFKALGRPVMIGASRKSFIGNVLNLPSAERLEGSLASAVISIMNGADIIRTHDVKETIRAAKMVKAIREVV